MLTKVSSSAACGGLASRWRCHFCADCSHTLRARWDLSPEGQGPPCLCGMVTDTPAQHIQAGFTPHSPRLSSVWPCCPTAHLRVTRMRHLMFDLNSSASWVPSLTDVTLAATLMSVILKFWARLRHVFTLFLTKVRKCFGRRLPTLHSWENCSFFLR